MSNKESLLNKIESKYILRKIISNAYCDMKSIFKLTKYNKKLLNKLDLNIEDHYNYKLKIKIEKNKNSLIMFWLSSDIYMIILVLIYMIMFYSKGAFNQKILKKEYNEKKKRFVDIMDNYILLAYLVFIIIFQILNFLIFNRSKIFITGQKNFIFFLVKSLVEIIHYICYIIKYKYTTQIIKKEYLKSQWFYKFDITLIVFMTLFISYYFIFLIYVIICFFQNDLELSDQRTFYLNQIQRFKINEFQLPSKFDKLNKKEQYEFIFKKENIEKYEYILNANQILLINKINNIRDNYNIPKLKYNTTECLPDFIVNEKTELVFNEEKYIHKISDNLYIFNYPKNEFQNLLYTTEIISILTNDYLDSINILEKNSIELISIYNCNNINKPNMNNNHRRIISLDIKETNIINTEDNLKDLNLDVTDIK